MSAKLVVLQSNPYKKSNEIRLILPQILNGYKIDINYYDNIMLPFTTLCRHLLIL